MTGVTEMEMRRGRRPKRYVIGVFALSALCLTSRVTVGQTETTPKATDPGLLTIDRLFRSGEFGERGFGGAVWEEEGGGYLRLERAVNGGGQELARYDAATGTRTVVVAAERFRPTGAQRPLTIEGYRASRDGKRLLIFTNSARVWRQNTRGDFWTLDIGTGKLTKLGGDAKESSLQFAKLSPDGRSVGYVHDNDLYVQAEEGTPRRLTRDGSRTIVNGTSDWVYEEELDVRDAWRWSPDGKSIAYWQFDTSGVKDYTLVNSSDTLYPSVKTFGYPKAGETNSAVRVGVVSVRGGTTRWLAIPGDPRNNYIARMDWAPNARDLTVVQLNRLQNTAHVWLADARTGKVTPLLTETDSAWLDVWKDVVPGGLKWNEDGKAFLWASERSGWRHIYRVTRDGAKVTDITPGAYDVEQVDGVDEKGGWLYFTSTLGPTTQRYLYRTRLDGSGRAADGPERVSPAGEAGTHRYNIAPGCAWAIHSWSNFTTPSRYEIVKLPTHEAVRVLADNADLRARLARLKLGKAEFSRVDAGGGLHLDSWMIKPPDFDPQKRYPVLVYIYGEPAGLTVLDSWMGTEYLWHAMLAQQGYIVVSFENRGTPSPRGREWRKSVYRKIGVVASDDQAGAIRTLSKLPYIDPKRIGVWGWSGGGSMTLNLLFRYPELYQVGMSVAPVPDMRLYDTIYQERYMGLPQENAEDYRRGSPITYVSRLAGDLLIVHGTGDDNVHFQGTERLINALVAANRPFTMMAYPNRSHGIYEGENTTRHLYTLLTRFLHEKLPAGGR